MIIFSRHIKMAALALTKFFFHFMIPKPIIKMYYLAIILSILLEMSEFNLNVIASSHVVDQLTLCE